MGLPFSVAFALPSPPVPIWRIQISAYHATMLANTSQVILVLAFSSEDATTQSQILQNAPLQS